MKKLTKIFLLFVLIYIVISGSKFTYKYYKINQMGVYYKEIYNKSEKNGCDYTYIQYMYKNNIITAPLKNVSFEADCPEKYIGEYIPKLLCRSGSSGITLELKNWCKPE